MHHSGFKFIKGAVTGMAIGAVKKTAGKANRAVGDIMDNVQYMMR